MLYATLKPPVPSDRSRDFVVLGVFFNSVFFLFLFLFLFLLLFACLRTLFCFLLLGGYNRDKGENRDAEKWTELGCMM